MIDFTHEHKLDTPSWTQTLILDTNHSFRVLACVIVDPLANLNCALALAMTLSA